MNVKATIKTASILVTTYDFELAEEQTEKIITHNTTKRAIEKLAKEAAKGKPYQYSAAITKETYTADIDEFLAIATREEK